MTGITNIIPSIGAKWLQLLKEIAPGVMRAATLVNPETQLDRGAIFLSPFQDAARTLGVKSANGEVHDLESIESVMAGLAKESNGGPVLAQSGHLNTAQRCPLLGVKQTSGGRAAMSPNDPKQTFDPEDRCHAK